MTTASESLRENRVNQSGSVALSTEAMRGPPWRNLLIIMALFTQKSGYEPGGRGFESYRTQHIANGRNVARDPVPSAGLKLGLLVRVSLHDSCGSSLEEKR